MVRLPLCILHQSASTSCKQGRALAVNPQEVPAGDWYCWSCCIQRKRTFPFPTLRVRVTHSNLITEKGFDSPVGYTVHNVQNYEQWSTARSAVHSSARTLVAQCLWALRGA